MNISSNACEDLNDRLSSIGIQCIGSLSSDDVRVCTQNFLLACNALLNELRKHDKSIICTKPCTSVDEIVDAIFCRSPCFTRSADLIQYKIISFLVAEIQVERLESAQRNKLMTHHYDSERSKLSTDSVSVQDRGIMAFQLDKVCKLLNVHVCQDDSNERGIIERIHSHISAALQEDPTLVAFAPNLLLPHIAVLNPQQMAKVEAVQDLLFQDFALRREMLTKRMEVTVESFLWSEKASCLEHEDEIRAAVRAQQHHLATPPMRYQLCDAAAANVALLHEQSKKVTGDSQLTASTFDSTRNGEVRVKSIIKQILVGAVPDRGGRASEVRPKQLQTGARHSFGKNSNTHGRGNAGSSSGNQLSWEKAAKDTGNNSGITTNDEKSSNNNSRKPKAPASTNRGNQPQQKAGERNNKVQQQDSETHKKPPTKEKMPHGKKGNNPALSNADGNDNRANIAPGQAKKISGGEKKIVSEKNAK